MKQLIIIFLTILSLTSYSQGKYPITVSGSGGGSGTSGRYTTNDFGTLVDSATTNVYKIIVDTTVIASQARLSTMLALKLNISDTAGMLSGYQTAINARVKYTDTSSMLSGYQTAINKNTDSVGRRWGVTGNSGLSATNNFAGNTDNVPMFFRVNNIKRGGFDTSTYNGSLLTGLFSLGNYLIIPTASKSALFISDSARLSGDEFRFGQTTVVTGGKVGGTASQGQIMAGQFEPRIAADNTANWTSGYGMVGVRGSNNIQPGATGTITHGRSFNAVADYSAMTVTNRYGYYAENAFLHGTGAITNQYGVYIEAMTGAGTNYGIYNLTGNNQFIGGTLADGITAFTASGTLANVSTGTNNGVNFQITGAGSTNANNRGLNVDLLAGYGGAGSTLGIRELNASAGTGVFTITGGLGNYGVQAGASAVSTGSKIGVMGYAIGGDLDIGLYGRANSVSNSKVHIGVLGHGRNAATSGIGIAGYFTQDTAALSTATATTVYINNGNQANALTLWQDNGTTVAQIADGGAMRIGDATSPTDKLEVTGNFALTTAGNKLKIATGSNASIGVSGAMTAGSITISTTAVTASSKIFLTIASVGGTPGVLSVGTITAGTSFVINSSSGTDTSTVNWWIVN